MKIAIDIDGVIRDFESAVDECLRRRGMIPPDFPKPEITEWQMEKFYPVAPKKFYQVVFDSIATHQIFAFANAYEGASAFIESLLKHHRVGLVSSQNYRSWVATLQWIHYQEIFTPSFHCCRFDLGDNDKAQFGYEIILDDKPEHVERFMELGLRGYLFDRPWNQKADLPRVKSYSEFLGIVGSK